ncbi:MULTISPECIES: BACON domain-containing protein [unclassified Sphingobacterium]|uniref:BACON domain-containing protein n=1 Tax=unclassified Sphingobacterium TaxID=2609468 RepID=UPI00143B8D04|nr:BACON domain-containing protein [Sphingobacterium sp. B16(2022)]NJI72571.1 BACON domain-containing protein [Sphingobacterium sp. B16(2022)]
MKIFIYKKGNIGFLILLILFALVACKKEDLPAKPVAGPFQMTSTVTNEIEKIASTYTISIEGTTNGWWVTLPANVQWYTMERKYGSGNVTQKLTIKANDSGQDRSGWVKINSTSKEEVIINFKQKGS